MNTGYRHLFKIWFQSLWTHRSGTAGSHRSFLKKSLRNFLTVFRRSWTSFNFHQHSTRVSFSSHLYQHVLSLAFWTPASPAGVAWCSLRLWLYLLGDWWSEHLFMQRLNTFFRKMSIRPLAHCFPLENGDDGDKVISYWGMSSYIDIKSLSDIWFADIFLLGHRSPFRCVIAFFLCRRFLDWRNPPCLLLLSLSYSNNHCPDQSR